MDRRRQDSRLPTPSHLQQQAVAILGQLNLHKEQIGMPDTWVRMRLGAAVRIDPDNRDGTWVADPKSAIEQLVWRRCRTRAGTPTSGGMIPPMLADQHVTVMFSRTPTAPTAGQGATHRTTETAPRAPPGKPGGHRSATPDQSDRTRKRHRLRASSSHSFLLAVDGLMHGHCGRELPRPATAVTSDQLQAAAADGPKTNQQLASISATRTSTPRTHAVLRRAPGLEEIIGGP